MHMRVKKLNPQAAVKMNEVNPKYENTPAINQSKSRIFIWGVIIKKTSEKIWAASE